MARRVVALALIPLALIAAGIIDGRRHRPVRGKAAPAIRTNVGPFVPEVPRREADNAAAFAPVMVGARALDSAWFCAAGTAKPDGAADARVVLANLGSVPAHATVHVVTDKHDTKEVPVTVPASGRASVRLGDSVTADWAAATVTADRGDIGANLVTTHDGSTSVTPCTTRASSAWYFAGGSTARGADEVLALYNPYPEPAAVSVQLETEEGARRPPTLQSIPVPPRSLVVRSLNQVEDQRDLLSLSVIAPVGRIVAARVQSYDGSGDPGPTGEAPKGLSVALGTPAPTTLWAWPYATKADGHSDRYVVFNPGESDANLTVEVALADPAKNGRIPRIPLQVPAGEAKVFDASGLRQVLGNTNFAVTIRSTNGVPVVAERLAEVTTGSVTGVSLTPGSPLLATRWVVPAVDVSKGSAFVSVANPGTVPVTVRLQVLGAKGVPPAPVTIPPGDRHDFSVAGLQGGDSPVIVVDADHPVLTGTLQQQQNAVSFAMAVPEHDSVSLP